MNCRADGGFLVGQVMNVSLREREEFAHKVLSLFTTSFRDARRMIRHILTHSCPVISKRSGCQLPGKTRKVSPGHATPGAAGSCAETTRLLFPGVLTRPSRGEEKLRKAPLDD